jgi:hypothetical protein
LTRGEVYREDDVLHMAIFLIEVLNIGGSPRLIGRAARPTDSWLKYCEYVVLARRQDFVCMEPRKLLSAQVTLEARRTRGNFIV